MATKQITINKFYADIIRRNKNDIMDHFSIDNTRKETLPKYISAINKQFIYLKPKSDSTIISEKILNFEFPARDTLSIGRINRETSSKIQLKGVNTNDKNIISTLKYEGISDENNQFHLIFLNPLEQTNDNGNFQFNRWWLGLNQNQNTLIGGLEIKQTLQKKQIEFLKVIEGKFQKIKLEEEKLEPVSETQIIKDIQILSKKTELNNIRLKF